MKGGLRLRSKSRAAQRSGLTSFSEVGNACVEFRRNIPELLAGTWVYLNQAQKACGLGKCTYPVRG